MAHSPRRPHLWTEKMGAPGVCDGKIGKNGRKPGRMNDVFAPIATHGGQRNPKIMHSALKTTLFYLREGV